GHEGRARRLHVRTNGNRVLYNPDCSRRSTWRRGAGRDRTPESCRGTGDGGMAGKPGASADNDISCQGRRRQRDGEAVIPYVAGVPAYTVHAMVKLPLYRSMSLADGEIGT